MKNEGLEYIYSLAEWRGEGLFSLDKVKLILNEFGNPQDKVKTIIVGGTNGKGSVSATIASILGAARFRVGLNISPHLSEITERILIDGYPITENEINSYALQLKKVSQRTNTRLSFHEGITVIYFLVAEALNLDWSVLEVGLGGKFDAANVVISPRALAIVSIGFDHEHILGGTLSEIAKAKAGIFRDGAILVTGNVPQDAERVFDSEASKYLLQYFKYSRDYSWNQINAQTVEYLSNNIKELEFNPQLIGEHQLDNTSVAIKLCRALNISSDICKTGIEQVFWPGRLEWIKFQGKELLFDCAHNPAGIKSLCTYLTSLDNKNIRAIFGVVSSKRWKEMVDLLIPFISEWILAPPQVSQALECSIIGDYLIEKGIQPRYLTLEQECILNELTSTDKEITIVTGSIYLLGTIRKYIIKDNKPIWKRATL